MPPNLALARSPMSRSCHPRHEDEFDAGGVLPRVWLEIVRGRTRYPVRPVRHAVFLLGRAEDCDLVLADRLIPESYLYLLLSPVGVGTRWLGDGPELHVNRRRVVDHCPLHDGDTLRFAQYEMRVFVNWARSRSDGAFHVADGTEPADGEPHLISLLDRRRLEPQGGVR